MRLLGVVMVPCCLSRGFVPAGQRGVVGRGFNAAGLRRRGADAGSSAVIGRSGAHLFAAACTPARLVCCRRVCSLVHDRHVRACVSGTQYVCAQYSSIVLWKFGLHDPGCSCLALSGQRFLFLV